CAGVFPHGLVHFWFRPLWAWRVCGRASATARLAGGPYLRCEHAHFPAQQHFRDIYKRALDEVWAEATRFAWDHGAGGLDDPARIRNKTMAALRCVYSHVSRL